MKTANSKQEKQIETNKSFSEGKKMRYEKKLSILITIRTKPKSLYTPYYQCVIAERNNPQKAEVKKMEKEEQNKWLESKEGDEWIGGFGVPQGGIPKEMY